MIASNDSGARVRHTHEVLENFEASQVAMESAAGSVRGFVLTGDEGYLERYRASLLSLGHEAAVRSLTVDNPEQQRRVTDLEALTAQRLQRARMNVGLRQTAGFAAAEDTIRSRPGQQAKRHAGH
jgi:methyl-accepting chemotaxis protein